jgi:hypothetical protein
METLKNTSIGLTSVDIKETMGVHAPDSDDMLLDALELIAPSDEFIIIAVSLVEHYQHVGRLQVRPAAVYSVTIVHKEQPNYAFVPGMVLVAWVDKNNQKRIDTHY